MASKLERSFGARLRRAQDLATYLLDFDNYAPPRNEESIVSYSALLSTIVAANSDETTIRQNYNTIVTKRYKAFRKDDLSVFKLLAPIRAVVIAQYGKKSTELNQVNAIVHLIRNSKLRKTIAADGVTIRKLSSSHQSFGSSIQYFKDLITTLETFPDYNPSKTELQLPQLNTFINNLSNLNDNVAINLKNIKTIKDQRLKLYATLSDSSTRIKAYIKGNYGIKSQEYQLIKGLSI